MNAIPGMGEVVLFLMLIFMGIMYALKGGRRND